jgi:hypothetical protein
VQNKISRQTVCAEWELICFQKGTIMKATWLYRIAAVVFLAFALGHTFGFLSFRPSSAEGRAVFDEMNNIHFVQSGTTYSYGRFYRGFGLSISVSMIFSAFLAWHLGELARKLPQAIGALSWIFFSAQVAGVAISLKYFGPPQALFSALLAVCVGSGAWLVPGRAA